MGSIERMHKVPLRVYLANEAGKPATRMVDVTAMVPVVLLHGNEEIVGTEVLPSGRGDCVLHGGGEVSEFVPVVAGEEKPDVGLVGRSQPYPAGTIPMKPIMAVHGLPLRDVGLNSDEFMEPVGTPVAGVGADSPPIRKWKGPRGFGHCLMSDLRRMGWSFWFGGTGSNGVFTREVESRDARSLDTVCTEFLCLSGVE